MRAMQVSPDLRLKEVQMDLPDPGTGEVKVRIRRAGICGSDVGILGGRNPYVKLPVVIGHEFSGEISQVDSDCAREVGERVVVRPTIGCGRCNHCAAGQVNRCAQLQIFGVHRDGGFAQEIIVPCENAVPMPDGMTFVQGAATEPTAVAVHMCRLVGVSSGDRVAVIGAGSIGLLAVQVARAMSARYVLAIDQNPARLELAEQLGADLTLQAEAVEQHLPEFVEDSGFDRIIELVGLESTMSWALQLSKMGGSTLLGAVPREKMLALDFVTAYRKELKVCWSRCFTNGDFESAMSMIHAGDVLVEPLVSPVMPLRELDQAFDLLKRDPYHHVKIMVSP